MLDHSFVVIMDGQMKSITKLWRVEKNRSVSIKSSAYDTYFGLSTTALASEDEFEVKEDATKAEIKRAFGKSLKGKKMNKKILSEFIELVAWLNSSKFWNKDGS